jgi:hypothetical protein
MSNTASLPLTISDLLCETDLDPNGGETTSDLQTLAQDILHILIEAPGSNPDDPDRGVGCEGLLGNSSANLGAAAGTIDAQLRKDDRIDSSLTTLTTNPDGSYNLTIQVVPTGAVLPLTLNYNYSNATGLVPQPS